MSDECPVPVANYLIFSVSHVMLKTGKCCFISKSMAVVTPYLEMDWHFGIAKEECKKVKLSYYNIPHTPQFPHALVSCLVGCACICTLELAIKSLRAVYMIPVNVAKCNVLRQS